MTDENQEPVPKKEMVSIPKNYLIITVIVVVAIAGILIGQMTGKFVEPTPKQPGQTKQSCPFECCINEPDYESRVCQGSNYQCVNNKCVKTNCPYECCLEGEYSTKPCTTDYECQNNKCVAVDSDKDGLTDVEEKQFGSNPLIYDTDSDGLNDYQEKIKGTNPNNQNTDGDRYNDNSDLSPTVKNTAIVDTEIVKKEWNWEWLGILDLLENLKKLNPDFTIATAKIDLKLCNNGNDYTSYVKFDNVFKIQGTEVMRVSERIDRLNENDCINKHYEYKFTAKQVPQTIWEVIQQKTTNWSYEVQNLVYEKF